MSNNVFPEQSNLVYRHFLCFVAYLFFCILLFFYGMLNVGYYFLLSSFFFFFFAFQLVN